MGLSDTQVVFAVDDASLQGQATFLGDQAAAAAAAVAAAAQNNNYNIKNNPREQQGQTTQPMQAKLVSFETAVADAGGRKPTLLHMNCEGCEWDMLTQMAETGFLQGIPVLQIGWHNYGRDASRPPPRTTSSSSSNGSNGMGSRVWQQCQIHALLERTHRMEWGVAFGWARWILKETPTTTPL